MVRFISFFKVPPPGSDPGRRPFALNVRSSRALILTTVSMSVFTDIFLYAVVVPVLPFSLPGRVGIKRDDTQYWVSVLLAVYGAFLLAGSPIFGWVADKTNTRRAPLLFGLLLLAGATVMLFIGSSIAVLIVGRALQGLSGSVVWTTGLALLVDTVGQKDIAYSMGYVMMSLSLAVLLAPLLGGVVYNSGGYNSVFAMCFGLLGFDILLRLVMIEKKHASRWDVVSAETSSNNDESKNEKATSLPRDADVNRTERDTSADNIPSNQPSPVTAPPSKPVGLFSKMQLPPVITLLKSRRLLVALWGSMVQAALITAFDALLPLRVREVFGWNSLGAGLIYLPIVLPSLASPLIGWVCDRYGSRWLSTIGFVLVVPFMVLLRLVDHNDIRQKVLLCALLFFIGLSINLAFAPLMAEIAYCVEAKERRQPGIFGAKGAYGQAYGLSNVAFATGCLVGPLWGGLVKEAAGWGTATWTLSMLSGISALPVALWVGGWIFKADSQVGWRRRKSEADQERGEVEQTIRTNNERDGDRDHEAIQSESGK